MSATAGTAPRAGDLAARARGLWDRHPGLLGYPLLLVLVWLARPSSWRKPVPNDGGQYLYVGQAILDGGTPYADAANNKGPLLYLVFAAIRLLAGDSTVLVRGAMTLFVALAALAVAGYVARAAGRAAGILAGVTFALLSGAIAIQADDVNTEPVALAPMAGAWYLATKPGARWALAAGAAAAAAIAINVLLAIVVVPVAWELWRSAEPGGRLRRLLTAAAGGLLVLVPIALWLALAGALGDMIAMTVGQAAEAQGTGSRLVGDAPGGLRAQLNVPIGGLWVAGALGALIAARRPALRGAAVGALLWIVLVLLRVKLLSYEYPHHYLPGLIGISAGLALGVATLWPARTRDRVALGSLVLVLACWSAVVVPQWNLLAVPPWQRWGPTSPFTEQAPVAAFARRATRPGDTILNAAFPQVYWLAGRQAPTRFFDIWTVGRRASWQRERRRALAADPPDAIALLPGESPDADIEWLLANRPYALAYDVRGGRVWLLQN